MEENQNSNTGKCAKKALVVGVIVSLVFSFLSLVLSVVTLLGSTGAIPEISSNSSNLPISKKYDRGQSFKKAEKKNKPVVVFFYVDWCGFCQRFAPTFNEIAKSKEIKKDFAIAYVNCDNPDNRGYIEEYGIQGFPTVFVVDPKTNVKTQLKNEIFFSPNAKEDVTREIREFLRAK